MHGGQPRVDSVILHDAEPARGNVLDVFRIDAALSDEQNVGHGQIRLGEDQITFALGRPGKGSEKVHLPPLDGFEDIGPVAVGDGTEPDPQFPAHEGEKVRRDPPGDSGGVEELEGGKQWVGGVPDGAVGGDEGAFLGG